MWMILEQLSGLYWYLSLLETWAEEGRGILGSASCTPRHYHELLGITLHEDSTLGLFDHVILCGYSQDISDSCSYCITRPSMLIQWKTKRAPWD